MTFPLSRIATFSVLCSALSGVSFGQDDFLPVAGRWTTKQMVDDFGGELMGVLSGVLPNDSRPNGSLLIGCEPDSGVVAAMFRFVDGGSAPSRLRWRIADGPVSEWMDTTAGTLLLSCPLGLCPDEHPFLVSILHADESSKLQIQVEGRGASRRRLTLPLWGSKAALRRVLRACGE